MAAVASLTPVRAIAQSMSGNQSHKSGMNGFGGMSSGLSSAPRMGSSGGTGSSAAGGFGSRSGGAGQHGGAGGSTMGSATGGSQSLGSPTGSSGSQSGSSGNKTPAPKLQSASKATAGSSSHSLYDYNYGAGDSGRTADSIYKSKDEAAPTDNYKWGATDLR
jgi:hypothetical protein